MDCCDLIGQIIEAQHKLMEYCKIEEKDIVIHVKPHTLKMLKDDCEEEIGRKLKEPFKIFGSDIIECDNLFDDTIFIASQKKNPFKFKSKCIKIKPVEKSVFLKP